MLCKRLMVAAEYVRKGACCVDVGTDHGYLAVYLYNSGITDKITACDINNKPLEAAKKTIAENNLADKIKLVLSDGLDKILGEAADDIVICGMGGELIMSIILASSYTREENRRFILQPMTNVPYLRKALYENGFSILDETPVAEKNHIYTVMLVCYSGEKVDVTELFCMVGKIQNSKSDEAKHYLTHQYRRIKKIADGLKRSSERLDEANSYYELARGVADILGGKQ